MVQSARKEEQPQLTVCLVLQDRCLKTTDRFVAVRRVMDGNGTPAGMDPVKHALQTSSKKKNNVLA